MDQRLVEQYRRLCNAIGHNQAILVELSEEPNRPNAICLVRREGGQLIATPIATLIMGEVQPFSLTPQHCQRLDPRRN